MLHVRFSSAVRGQARQTVDDYGVDVAHELVLLFGIGTNALPSWDSKTRWDNPDRFYDDGGEASLHSLRAPCDKQQALAEWEALLQVVGHRG
jgi:hypothetical protein